MSEFFSFRLLDDFVAKYKDLEPPFGFVDAGGNSLGEVTFIRTYSRVKEDGTKERFFEVCRRVIEGMYSVQKNHAKENRLPWNDNKAQKSAQEAFDRMFNLKWTPPGRGLWAFGTPMTMEKRNSASLQNCAMVSTRDIDRNDPGALFSWVMDALMLGVGVGFDTLGDEKGMLIYAPTEPVTTYEIPALNLTAIILARLTWLAKQANCREDFIELLKAPEQILSKEEDNKDYLH